MDSFNAGEWVDQGHYTSFQPNSINRDWKLDDMELLGLLSRADRYMGRLDMYSEHIPDIDLFITMHVTKEATQSSKIEGTQTKIEEALLEKEQIVPKRRDDWVEVQNYIAAMDHAISQLKELPFSSRLIRDTHRILMTGVRGEHKQPGEFRRSQNWIGGRDIDSAKFVPPVHESIPELMSDLEHFVHSEELRLPDLIKVALMHYQFETIHPFLDGNGRVGRLMITLYLVSKSILKRPVLYLSDFFEKHRLNYYESLTQVRENHDLSQWIRFFLTGVIETAQNSVDTLDAVLKLQKRVEEQIEELGSRAGNAQILMRHLYKNPIVSADRVRSVVEVSMPTAYSLINALEKRGILKEVTGAERNRLFMFEEYVNLFRES